MVNLKKYAVMGSREKQIFMDLTYNDDSSGLVVFCHGYKGYKDWGAWNEVATYFAANGFAFLKFNFSYNGCTPNELIDFPDLEAFGQNNYSTELKDLGKVIEFIESDALLSSLAKNFKGLIGHSRGGGIAILAAAKYDYFDALITWASVADFKRRFPSGSAMVEWKKEGVYHVVNGRTKQNMPHYYQFFEDFIKHEKELDIQSAATRISQAWLIIHGDNDEAVNISEARELQVLNDKAKLITVHGTGHTFETKHPWIAEELPKAMKLVCDQTIDFFRKV